MATMSSQKPGVLRLAGSKGGDPGVLVGGLLRINRSTVDIVSTMQEQETYD